MARILSEKGAHSLPAAWSWDILNWALFVFSLSKVLGDKLISRIKSFNHVSWMLDSPDSMELFDNQVIGYFDKVCKM